MKSTFGFELKMRWLCCEQQRFQFECSEQKLSSGIGERDYFVLCAAGSKVLPNFLEGSAEALGRRQRAETQHRVVSLLESPVISFNSTIHVCAAAMRDVRTESFPDCPRIGIVAVCSDLLRC